MYLQIKIIFSPFIIINNYTEYALEICENAASAALTITGGDAQKCNNDEDNDDGARSLFRNCGNPDLEDRR